MNVSVSLSYEVARRHHSLASQGYFIVVIAAVVLLSRLAVEKRG